MEEVQKYSLTLRDGLKKTTYRVRPMRCWHRKGSSQLKKKTCMTKTSHGNVKAGNGPLMKNTADWSS